MRHSFSITLAFALWLNAASVALDAQITQPTTEGMVAYTMDHRGAMRGRSPVDVSFLLDAPAGKDGFIRVMNGHLATGNGKRIRFWGVNITDWSKGSRQIPSREDAPLWAATLARFGVNCVRFQFLDLETPRGLIQAGRPDTRALDAEAVDREDFFIAELEKRGIYIDFNLLVGRPFKAGDGVEDANLLREGAKGTSLFDSRMITLQKEYARQLLDHLNPYTRQKYASDPAVAIIEINNENALEVGFHAPSAFYQNELTRLYNRWLSGHRTPEQIAALRDIAGTGNIAGSRDVGSSVAGTASLAPVPLVGWRGEQATAPPERFYAEAEFYDDIQRSYFADMGSYLKQTLGAKSLIMATADHNHASSGYPLLLATSPPAIGSPATTAMDIIDGHTYWQHPGMYVHKLPMVNDPFNSTVVELSRTAIAGKPYTVSEVNNAFPNDYAGEGIPILAGYGALQDWDGIFWYTFEPKADPAWKPYVGDAFDISLDPVKMPELAEGALLFLRGDVAKARTTSERSYTREQVFDSLLLPTTDRPYFTPGFPLHLPLEHEVRISSLNGPVTQPFAEMATPDPIVSDTQELAWYGAKPQRGMVTIDTPRTQGLIGFVGANHTRVSHLSADVENKFCTLLLSSLDDKPISQSSRMLLVAGGRVENTGQRWNAAGTDVTTWGGPPTLIEQVKGTLTLRGLRGVRSLEIQPIDGGGQPLGTMMHGVTASDGWRVTLGEPVTTWYALTVER